MKTTHDYMFARARAVVCVCMQFGPTHLTSARYRPGEHIVEPLQEEASFLIDKVQPSLKLVHGTVMGSTGAAFIMTTSPIHS